MQDQNRTSRVLIGESFVGEGAEAAHVNTVLGGREKVTQIEKDVSSQATVAGINGDLFSPGDGHPAGRLRDPGGRAPRAQVRRTLRQPGGRGCRSVDAVHDGR